MYFFSNLHDVISYLFILYKMIQAKHIDKKFGHLEILKDIHISIKEKQIVAIIGPSGAGKSTLLHILASLDRPSPNKANTSIKINGEEITQLNDKKLSIFRNLYMGFVFQSSLLLPEFNALENILLPARIAKKDPIVMKKKAHELLEFLNLSTKGENKPSELSGGELQRVCIARALINDPKIIFADEPSGNLDVLNARKLHELFFKLRENFNQTFLIVTHNQELANMADRKLELKEGQLI